MTILREAAQQALEALKSCSGVPHWPALQPTIDNLRAALAQEQAEPVQEPVAWTLTKTLNKRETTTNGYLWFSDPVNSSWTPLYLAQPQRKPLAEWQINDLMAGIDPEDLCSWSFRQGVYAAEKHHGVKP